jgi:hypothetical protein
MHSSEKQAGNLSTSLGLGNEEKGEGGRKKRENKERKKKEKEKIGEPSGAF